MVAVYNIAWGQCSALMQNRLESLEDYNDMKRAHDVTKLLKEIRKISNKLQVSANVYNAPDEVKRFFLHTFNRTMIQMCAT